MQFFRHHLFKNILSLTIVLTFFTSVPFAIRYCRNYQTKVFSKSETEPLIIEVAAIECGKYISTFRTESSRFTSQNKNVRIFILPLTKEQLVTHNFPIIISKEDNILYIFISKEINHNATEQCQKFIKELATHLTEIELKIT